MLLLGQTKFLLDACPPFDLAQSDLKKAFPLPKRSRIIMFVLFCTEKPAGDTMQTSNRVFCIFKLSWVQPKKPFYSFNWFSFESLESIFNIKPFSASSALGDAMS